MSPTLSALILSKALQTASTRLSISAYKFNTIKKVLTINHLQPILVALAVLILHFTPRSFPTEEELTYGAEGEKTERNMHTGT